MKSTLWIVVLLLLFSCNKKAGKDTEKRDNSIVIDSTLVIKSTEEKQTVENYSNERFRGVTIEKIGEETFRVKGEAQIFEANFNWIVEDGHNELKNGFAMTDAGAPEWGKFNFTISIKKTANHSTLHLILFEISAKDGSRQYELPITLK
jgi:hypothetical protein